MLTNSIATDIPNNNFLNNIDITATDIDLSISFADNTTSAIISPAGSRRPYNRRRRSSSSFTRITRARPNNRNPIIGHQVKLYKQTILKLDGSHEIKSCQSEEFGAQPEAALERYYRNGKFLKEPTLESNQFQQDPLIAAVAEFDGTHQELFKSTAYRRKMYMLSVFECFVVYVFSAYPFAEMIMKWMQSTPTSEHVAFIPCPVEIANSLITIMVAPKTTTFPVVIQKRDAAGK